MAGLNELQRATVKNMRKQLQTWVDCASQEEKRQARGWYLAAHELAIRLAERFNITSSQAAGVLSVLSPGTRWENNILDAEAVMVAWKERTYDATVSTYGRQLAKAYVILDDCSLVYGVDLEPYIGKPTARKTIAFYHNIRAPLRMEHVTIDRWILRALGLPVNRTTPQLYRLGTLAVKQIARKYDWRPCEMQALVWVCIRNRGGAPQTAFDLPGF